MILCLTGSALAAKGALTGKQRKEVAKIAKKEAQKYANSNPGAPGANGTNGTNGKEGAPGAPGEKGDPGENGKSVTVTTVASPNCEGQAGAEVKQEGAGSGVKVCNGANGANGTNGTDSPFAGGHLATGVTELGAFDIHTEATSGSGATAISFNIPLAAALDETHVVIINTNLGDTPPASCDDGNAADGAPSPANPEADPGFLCVFTRIVIPNPDLGAIELISDPGTGTSGAGRMGADLLGGAVDGPPNFNNVAADIQGTWAVTGA